MSAPKFEISVWDEPERCVLRLNGCFGVGEAEELRQTALGLCAREMDIHIDWQGAAQVDASIVQVLWSLRRAVAGAGRSFSASAPGEAVGRYLQAAGLVSILDTATPA